ncbi:probable E3 ubiquitin-protein ligase sinah [Drosophila guanche]|uniref:E3 ubiquitin-protein ligase n=1 Tax=Drosophila guanche TaxID=7266 RepID=A0A3B0KQL4_DROGU|nr:probable E3 ubiquitin-protein ligase sinah [Drosophila guanche]SPP87511.1 blast:Probable E3 ubiquitin-protein ligase sinah [Drosophila guanche]
MFQRYTELKYQNALALIRGFYKDFAEMLPRRQSAPELPTARAPASVAEATNPNPNEGTGSGLELVPKPGSVALVQMCMLPNSISNSSPNLAASVRQEQPQENAVVRVEAPMEGPLVDFYLSLLECPVCFGYIMPPIMQCSRGHLICSGCRHKLTLCPVCRVPMSNIRNIAMENVASKLFFPCKHSHCGCKLILTYSEKKRHEDDCEYRPFFCPYPDEKCEWEGPLEDVFGHLIARHENVITMEGHDIIFLATNVDLEGALDWTMVQSCHGRQFLLSLEKIHLGEGCQQFFAACRMIGTMRDAAEFDYSILLESNNRTLRWQSKPRSIRESFVTFTNADFLVLNKSTVELFSEDGNLALNVIITPTDEDSQ